jgi:hypothetical protein
MQAKKSLALICPVTHSLNRHHPADMHDGMTHLLRLDRRI